MTVDVHGKGCGGVTQILLERLNVHAALDAGHGVGVPQIVESGNRIILESYYERIPAY